MVFAILTAKVVNYFGLSKKIAIFCYFLFSECATNNRNAPLLGGYR